MLCLLKTSTDLRILFEAEMDLAEVLSLEALLTLQVEAIPVASRESP
jgi:hypothetical protein